MFSVSGKKKTVTFDGAKEISIARMFQGGGGKRKEGLRSNKGGGNCRPGV